MIYPTIHANGTTKERLLEAIEGASLALKIAEEKLAQTAPNGRDYYPQGAYAVPACGRGTLAAHAETR